MYNSVIYLATTFLLAQVLTGCWSSVRMKSANASLGDITSINIIINDNFYGENDTNLTEPPVWTVPSGADVVATMNNLGNLTHNWAIIRKDESIPVPFNEGQSSNIIEYGAGMIYGQNHTTMTFTAPEELGTYLVICTVPGHYPSMQGRLQVK